jgi:hypothetical protein
MVTSRNPSIDRRQCTEDVQAHDVGRVASPSTSRRDSEIEQLQVFRGGIGTTQDTGTSACIESALFAPTNRQSTPQSTGRSSLVRVKEIQKS